MSYCLVKFPIRNGIHIERKTGVNFSILGRANTCFIEEEYVKWDKLTNREKERLLEDLG